MLWKKAQLRVGLFGSKTKESANFKVFLLVSNVMKVEEVLYPCHHPHLHCLNLPLCLNPPFNIKIRGNPLNRQHESRHREPILLMKLLFDLHSHAAISRLG